MILIEQNNCISEKDISEKEVQSSDLEEIKYSNNYNSIHADKTSGVKQLTIQEALSKVGGSGKYQKLCYAFFGLQWMLTGMLLQAPIFLFLSPTYQCDNGLIDEECSNWVCKQEDPLKYATHIPNSFVMYFNPPLICDYQYVADTMMAINYSSAILGLLISSYIGDNKGRRFASLIFWMISGIGSIICGTLTQYEIIAFIGLYCSTFGANPTYSIVYCFINEHSDGNFRDNSAAFINVFYALGSIVLVSLQYLSDDWKIQMVFFIGIPIFISNIFYYFIYEPPIFLYQKDKKKALLVLNKIASINNRPQIQENELEDINSLSSQEELNDSNLSQYKFGLLTLFKYKSTLITTICCALIQFNSSFSYLGISLTLENIGFSIRINNYIISIFEMLGYVASGINQFKYFFNNFFCEYLVYLIQRMNRKRNFIIMILCNSLFLLFIFVKKPEDCDNSCIEQTIQSIIMGFARFLLSILISIHCTYSSELLPTTVRSLGFGFVCVVGEIGTVLCGYFITFFQQANINPIVCMGIMGLITSLFYLPLKETYNQPLEDNIPELVKQKKESKKSADLINKIEIATTNELIEK